ncbi:succinate dehydrogenase [Mesobacterium sp. TK19101]|uniref:Succinate dehydrogenase n=1 Tax=Mesobacterium hydrothermale TaxID=3111907 RepID=A0ABU6HBL7_9RHOB|nr:succinate dehydrogenase [Mesobacterium sp. TK19101]MEC3859848.1 succinate dehydrogenase [Mesobacterium sp. TK19101]
MRAVAVLSLCALTACTAANDAADALARDRAKTVVNGVVADRFPGVNAAPVTDCIIDNASASEILSVASASVTGVTEDTVETVVTIAQRPDTVSCIAGNGLALLSL